MMNAPDRWAPKSAKHDEHDAAVARARHWHAALHLAFLLLGAAAGYVAFQLADRELPLAFLESLYDDEYQGWEVLDGRVLFSFVLTQRFRL